MVDSLDSILKKHNNSWADVIGDIGINVGNPNTRMNLYIDALGKNIRDSSTLRTLHSEMKYTMLEMTEYTNKLEETSVTDELTGLYNKRFFNGILDKTIARVDRGNENASLIIADIDHFKLFNDKYGHLAGDRVLKVMGELLERGVRESDVTCRYGGEEFGIILPDTNRRGALDVAYKLNCKIADYPIGFEDENRETHNLPVNISVGVDQIKTGDSYKSLVDRVDKFLYQAKKVGRNCIVGPDGKYTPKN